MDSRTDGRTAIFAKQDGVDSWRKSPWSRTLLYYNSQPTKNGCMPICIKQDVSGFCLCQTTMRSKTLPNRIRILIHTYFCDFIFLSFQSFKGVVHKLRWEVFGFFDHLPPFVDMFYERWQKVDIFGPPRLVNVVCERPLNPVCKCLLLTYDNLTKFQ